PLSDDPACRYSPAREPEASESRSWEMKAHDRYRYALELLRLGSDCPPPQAPRVGLRPEPDRAGPRLGPLGSDDGRRGPPAPAVCAERPVHGRLRAGAGDDRTRAAERRLDLVPARRAPAGPVPADPGRAIPIRSPGLPRRDVCQRGLDVGGGGGDAGAGPQDP